MPTSISQSRLYAERLAEEERHQRHRRALLRSQRPGLYVSRPPAHLDDRRRRLASVAADLGAIFGELRCLVARRSHDSLRLAAPRNRRCRRGRRVHDRIGRRHDAGSFVADALERRPVLQRRRQARVSLQRRCERRGGTARARCGQSRRLRPASHRRAQHLSWGDTLARRYERRRRPLRRAAYRRNARCSTSTGPVTPTCARSILTNGASPTSRRRKGEAWSCSDIARRQANRRICTAIHAPGRRVVSPARRRSPRKLTDVNAGLPSVGDALAAAEFTVKDPSGFTVQAWFMPAIGGTAGRSIRRCSTFTAAPRRSSAIRSSTSFRSTRRWATTSSSPIRRAAPGTATPSKRRSKTTTATRCSKTFRR